MVYVPPQAPLVTLAFVASALLVAAAFAGILFGALSKRRRVVVGSAVLAAVVAGTYAIVWTGAAVALVRAGRTSTPLTEPLLPGASYRSLLVFDIPRDAQGVKFYVGNLAADSAFLIGHEASPLMKKAWFSLE